MHPPPSNSAKCSPGLKPGRTADDQITLYKSMGNAMEDMVVANLVYETALARGVGVELAR